MLCCRNVNGLPRSLPLRNTVWPFHVDDTFFPLCFLVVCWIFCAESQIKLIILMNSVKKIVAQPMQISIDWWNEHFFLDFDSQPWKLYLNSKQIKFYEHDQKFVILFNRFCVWIFICMNWLCIILLPLNFVVFIVVGLKVYCFLWMCIFPGESKKKEAKDGDGDKEWEQKAENDDGKEHKCFYNYVV